MELAIDHGNKRRFLVKSAEFQELYGARFAYTTDKTDEFRNDKTGYFICTSPDSAGTGFGGDLCIGDDLLNAQDAFSEATRKSTNRWLDDTFRRRLNNPVSGAFVHISQRLNDDDPTGHLLEKNPQEWIHIKIPREAVVAEQYVFPLTQRVVDRPVGDILQPQRCPPHVIASMKLVSRTWSGQEQQEPAPIGGAMFKANWWKYYQMTTPMPQFDKVIVSLDAAFKEYEENDYCRITPRHLRLPRGTGRTIRREQIHLDAVKSPIIGQILVRKPNARRSQKDPQQAQNLQQGISD